MELTRQEAAAVAEFIDIHIFPAIREDMEWDNFSYLRNLIHGYEKLCEFSGYRGVTDE